jgi:hypothetical protein
MFKPVSIGLVAALAACTGQDAGATPSSGPATETQVGASGSDARRPVSRDAGTEIKPEDEMEDDMMDGQARPDGGTRMRPPTAGANSLPSDRGETPGMDGERPEGDRDPGSDQGDQEPEGDDGPDPDDGEDPSPAEPTDPCDGDGSHRDGDRCHCDADCARGAVCSREDDEGIPGGMCIRFCEVMAGGECDADAKCIGPASNPSLAICWRSCGSSADCPAGRVCSGADQTCRALCSRDEECESGHCNAYNGFCQPEQDGLGLQASCTADDDCKSRFCNPAGSRCTSLCQKSDNFCPENGVCVSISEGDDQGGCYPPCVDENQCDDRTLQCGIVGVPAVSACAIPNAGLCIGVLETYSGDCRCGADCPNDATCYTEEDTGAPKGICIKQCADESGCDAGYNCTAMGAEPGYCVPRCQSDADCPSGDLCSAATGACLSLCQADEDCFSGQCNLYVGRCGSEAPAGLGAGAQCTGDDQCRSRICVVLGSGLGFCSNLCDIERQGCADGAICIDEGDHDRIGICSSPT